MAKYRNKLPQLGDGLYITDGGVETTLIFHEGLELPDFAAFHLLKTPEGEAALRKYFRTYAEIAKRFGTGLILESATWRANADWGTRLGYMPEALANANCRAIHLLEEIRDEYETDQTPMVISGCLGPRGDGYVPDRAMSEQEAETYHQAQVETLAGSAADMVCAITMNYVEEARGIVRAAQQVDMPVAISFTVETDGNLPSGQSLKTAIEQVDEATSGYPCYYMINCAHPTHFDHVVAEGGLWLDRIRGLRANASHKSHAELNESPEFDSGNPVELGAQYARLKERLARLTVMGGCCGTDHRHVEQIAEACSPLFRTAT
ncbi:homocysteine S-methyltransferase family protein [Undibacterium arcticum]|uniref:Homocysteine S-methyltransferase family protein n=1 Tax=Undibacterium arcticum TaxID=1762892 RepID=A0ABV7F715_9BURK